MRNSQSTLKYKLRQVEKVFDTNNVLSTRTNIESIARYYKVNKLAYTVFHRRNDFVHMGISRDGKFNDKDLLEHAGLVSKYIDKFQAKKVLELAAGRGANSEHLAKRYPDVSFDAIDLPDGQFDYAYKRAEKLNNFYTMTGDYHDLNHFKSESMDIVFVIEALCYSVDKTRVFSEVNRVLKTNGIFIVFDGYMGKTYSSLTSEELLAKRLTERGMVVENFDYYPDFKKQLLKSGFKVVEEEDASDLIMPTLRRFEKQAMGYFKIPASLLKILNKLLPPLFVNNVLSGYLMPTLISLGVARYIILVVTKRG